jgi:hypothetical protein
MEKLFLNNKLNKYLKKKKEIGREGRKWRKFIK